MDEKRDFILDHLSGLDANELAAKYGINQQAVAARLRFARERGEIERLRDETAQGHEHQPPDDGGEVVDDEPPASASNDKESSKASGVLTREDIAARFGTLQDKHNLGRLRNSARARIAAHEANIGRKDPGFRIQQELWIRKERARMLGLTFNDLRRLRGMDI